MLRREDIQAAISAVDKKLAYLEQNSSAALLLLKEKKDLEYILQFEHFQRNKSQSKFEIYRYWYQRIYDQQITTLYYKYVTDVKFKKGDYPAQKKVFEDYLNYQKKRLNHSVKSIDGQIKFEKDPFLQEIIETFNSISLNTWDSQLVVFVEYTLPEIRMRHQLNFEADASLSYDSNMLYKMRSSKIFEHIALYNATLAFQIPDEKGLVSVLNKTNQQNKAKAFTLAQQYYSLYYLFVQLRLDFETVTKTDIARFVQLLTNRELGRNITSSNIYKRVKKPFNKKDRNMVQDLEKILPFLNPFSYQQRLHTYKTTLIPTKKVN